jgi:ribosomal protein L7/L12
MLTFTCFAELTTFKQVEAVAVDLIQQSANVGAVVFDVGETAVRLYKIDEANKVAGGLSSWAIKAGVTAEQENDIRADITNHRFIQAIKLHRSLTGWGLKESKDACDELRASMGL